MEYLAKTNPKETVQEHTNLLLHNLKIIQQLYPNLNVNWRLLYFACLYHDLGKINPKFQKKLRTFTKVKGEIPHNILSVSFISPDYLMEEGFSEDDICILFQAVAYHHNRSTDFLDEEIEEEIKLMRKELEQFDYGPIENIKHLSERIDEDYFILGNRIYEEEDEFLGYVMLKGLLNRLDYAASGHIDVEVKNDFLENAMNQMMGRWQEKNPNVGWNELQRFMIDNKEENVITIAQTGMGKTEAGLLWIGNQKGFFTLPLKTAINEIYKRITQTIVEKKEIVGLLHSETFSKYLEGEETIEQAQDYYNKTKQLSLPLTVCTLDQIFDFVYRYMDFEPKLATLSYSKIVIDEIQMYSPDLLAYLIFGLDYITKVGGKFAILTATFPPFIEDELRERGIDAKKAKKPFIDNEMIRHRVKIIQEQIGIDKVVEKFNHNKILIVCNTVKKAQSIYEELASSSIDSKYLHMLHSKFIKKDRAQKESDIMKLGHTKNEDYGIWIGTQVVEASLDIDFELLFTELSDINGLLQRLGRCYRKREFKKQGYNCYVYVGDAYPCSGIRDSEHSIIDIDIFLNSKNALLSSKIDGAFTEESKLKLVDEVYQIEAIKNTNYYTKLKNTLEYLKRIDPYEMKKSEVKKRFRNILNVNVIPKPIYDENRDEILKLESTINRKLREDEDITKRRKERYESINQLRNYMVSISHAEAKNFISKSENIMIGEYEEIFILECHYSYEKGIVFERNKNKKADLEKEFDALFL